VRASWCTSRRTKGLGRVCQPRAGSHTPFPLCVCAGADTEDPDFEWAKLQVLLSRAMGWETCVNGRASNAQKAEEPAGASRSASGGAFSASERAGREADAAPGAARVRAESVGAQEARSAEQQRVGSGSRPTSRAASPLPAQQSVPSWSAGGGGAGGVARGDTDGGAEEPPDQSVASAAMLQEARDLRDRRKAALRDVLLNPQGSAPPEEGSTAPAASQWGARGGRTSPHEARRMAEARANSMSPIPR
jgi:hypothetical protein